MGPRPCRSRPRSSPRASSRRRDAQSSPEQPARTIVPISADGGSRGTICQACLATAIERLLNEREREYATKHKRRQALEDLEGALRAHQPATLIDDPVAERDLRECLVELSRRPAGELVSSGMYAAQRSLVAPAMVVVGFPRTARRRSSTRSTSW
jgi:hypothetical protein